MTIRRCIGAQQVCQCCCCCCQSRVLQLLPLLCPCTNMSAKATNHQPSEQTHADCFCILQLLLSNELPLCSLGNRGSHFMGTSSAEKLSGGVVSVDDDAEMQQFPGTTCLQNIQHYYDCTATKKLTTSPNVNFCIFRNIFRNPLFLLGVKLCFSPSISMKPGCTLKISAGVHPLSPNTSSAAKPFVS